MTDSPKTEAGPRELHANLKPSEAIAMAVDILAQCPPQLRAQVLSGALSRHRHQEAHHLELLWRQADTLRALWVQQSGEVSHDPNDVAAHVAAHLNVQAHVSIAQRSLAVVAQHGKLGDLIGAVLPPLALVSDQERETLGVEALGYAGVDHRDALTHLLEHARYTNELLLSCDVAGPPQREKPARPSDEEGTTDA